MNEEKKIAQAIVAAQKLREESYAPDSDDADGQGYTKPIEKCLMKTCKESDLSENMWVLLGLAMHWWNDIQLWAEDILADKKVIDSCMNEEKAAHHAITGE